jgi:hypothetical protein
MTTIANIQKSVFNSTAYFLMSQENITSSDKRNFNLKMNNGSVVIINLQLGKYVNKNRSYFFININTDNLRLRLDKVLKVAGTDSPLKYEVNLDDNPYLIYESVENDLTVFLDYIKQFGSVQDYETNVKMRS